VIFPELVISLLFGTELNEIEAIFVSRLTGVALITLSIICWIFRNAGQSASEIIKAMLFYNVAATALLVLAWMSGFSGVGIWPASLMHVALAVWCLKNLRE
jgi:hypothetical protein